METRDIKEKFAEYMDNCLGKYMKISPSRTDILVDYHLKISGTFDDEIAVLFDLKTTDGAIYRIYEVYALSDSGLSSLKEEAKISEFFEYFYNSDLYKALTGKD